MQSAADIPSAASLSHPPPRFPLRNPRGALRLRRPQDHPPQRRRGRPSSRTKISIALTKAFIAVNGGQAAASARIRELVENLTEQRRRRPDPAPAQRRHLPHRGHPGPGGTGPDALRRARSGPRLRAVPGEAQRGAQQAEAPAIPGKRPVLPGKRRAPAPQPGPSGLPDRRRLRGPAGDQPASHPASHPARHLRRRAHGRGAQVADPLRPLPDREGPGLQLRHLAPADALHPPRGVGRGSRPGRDGRPLSPTISPPTSSRASRPNCSTSA